MKGLFELGPLPLWIARWRLISIGACLVHWAVLPQSPPLSQLCGKGLSSVAFGVKVLCVLSTIFEIFSVPLLQKAFGWLLARGGGSSHATLRPPRPVWGIGKWH